MDTIDIIVEKVRTSLKEDLSSIIDERIKVYLKFNNFEINVVEKSKPYMSSELTHILRKDGL